MGKGLLIHSYNCLEPNWDHTVWGYPPDRPGRLVTGAKVILEERPEIALICGTAGEKQGKKECWWMGEKLYGGLAELKKFTVFPIFQQYSLAEIENIFQRTLVIKEKTTSANTAGEMECAGQIFHEAGITQAILVTSPDHISRCLRDALISWQERYPELALNLSGIPSATLYSERSVEDKGIAKISNVVIAEPPVMKKFNFARMFGILNNSQALFEIDVVLRKYNK